MGIFMLGWPGGGGWAAIKFVCEHPKAAWDITLFCLCGVVGQNFIFLIISHFGSLVTNIITTTRKFVSILISSLWNGNPLSFQQWASVVMVFTGLSYHIYLKWKQKAPHGHGGSKTPTYANEHKEDDGSQFVAQLRSRNSSTLWTFLLIELKNNITNHGWWNIYMGLVQNWPHYIRLCERGNLDVGKPRKNVMLFFFISNNHKEAFIMHLPPLCSLWR